MKRLHVHVSVDNLDKSIRFYSGMSGTEPTMVKTDYAKWMPEDSCVNFAVSHRGAGNGLNHLGIQVDSAAGLDEMQSRLTTRNQTAPPAAGHWPGRDYNRPPTFPAAPCPLPPTKAQPAANVEIEND